MSTKMSVNYGNSIYWQQRYKKNLGQQFDWLHSYEEIKQIFQTYIPSKTSRILYIGCGTSALADHLEEKGYINITCADISKQLIKQLKQRAKKRGKQPSRFKVLDATKLQQENQSYDVVIDKSMLDAILCGEDYLRKVLRALRQISRVLVENGVYLMFSRQSPNKRIYYLKNKLTKFKRVEYFPVKRFETIKHQNMKNVNESKDDIRSMASKVSKAGFDKNKRNHYCYVCIRKQGDLNVSRQSQRIIEEQKQQYQEQQQNQKMQKQEQKDQQQQNNNEQNNQEQVQANNQQEDNVEQSPENQQQKNEKQDKQDKQPIQNQQEQEQQNYYQGNDQFEDQQQIQ